MANKSLEELLPTLSAIDAAEVSEPDIPVAVELQESSDLEEVIKAKAVRAALMRVGLGKPTLDALAPATDATRAAQSQWNVTRDRSKSDSQREVEERGYALRSDIVAGCRWNLRGNRVAMGAISAIVEGDGIEDLVQDLVDLAELMDRNGSAFEKDETFDAKAKGKEARALSKELQTGISAARLTQEQAKAKALRDRAFTHLHGIVSEIREAGRYAFRHDDDMARRFASDYRRKHRVSAKPTTPPAPPEG